MLGPASGRGIFVCSAGKLRQELADFDARHIRGDGALRPAVFNGRQRLMSKVSSWLGPPHSQSRIIERGGVAAAALARRRKKSGSDNPSAEARAGLQHRAARDALAVAADDSPEFEHRSIPQQTLVLAGLFVLAFRRRRYARQSWCQWP